MCGPNDLLGFLSVCTDLFFLHELAWPDGRQTVIDTWGPRQHQYYWPYRLLRVPNLGRGQLRMVLHIADRPGFAKGVHVVSCFMRSQGCTARACAIFPSVPQ